MKPDGNVAFKVTWVYGKNGPFTSPCTAKGREINIRLARKVWCSTAECECRQIFDRKNKGTPDDHPCYDAAVFRDWEFGLGVIHKKGRRHGDPLVAKFIRAGRYAFLTSKRHGVPERDRLVIGAWKIAASPEDSDIGEMVRSVPNTRVRVRNLRRAPKYWRYHKQTGGPAWGTGLFRYLPDTEASRLYAAVVKAAK